MTLPTQYEAGDSVDESGNMEDESESEALPMEQSAPAVVGATRSALDVAPSLRQKKQ